MNADYVMPGMTGPFENAGAPTNGTNAVQTITVDATSGTWTVLFDGFTTAALAYNISGADLQAALLLLPNLDSGDVVVTGEGPYTLTFGGNLAKRAISVVTTNAASLVGNTHTAAVVNTVPGVTATARGASKGGKLIDTTNGAEYINTGTALVPNWVPASEGDFVQVYNGTGGSLAAGILVYLSGFDATSGLPKIVKADADASGSPAEYVLRDTIGIAGSGLVYKSHTLGTLNTNAGNVGDPVYLDTTAGGWTLTPPTGATARVEVVGTIAVKSATVGQIRFDLGLISSVGTNELQAKAVTGPKIALTNTHILVGDAGGAAADVALSGDATMANTGAMTIANNAVTTAKIADANVTAAKLANGAGVAAMLASGLGASAAFTKATNGVQTLLASNVAARVVIIIAVATEVFANGDGGQPTFKIGETDTDDKYAATSVFTDAANGAIKIFAGTLTANKALLVTAAAGTGTTETGAVSVTALVLPAAA